MRNKYKYLFFLITIFLVNPSFLLANDIFQFNATNLEITENGNIFEGSNGGEALTDDIEIKAKNFRYNKELNLLISYGEALITTSKSGLIDLFFFINSSDHISSHMRNLILFFLN